jgi:hypothetical protein
VAARLQLRWVRRAALAACGHPGPRGAVAYHARLEVLSWHSKRTETSQGRVVVAADKAGSKAVGVGAVQAAVRVVAADKVVAAVADRAVAEGNVVVGRAAVGRAAVGRVAVGKAVVEDREVGVEDKEVEDKGVAAGRRVAVRAAAEGVSTASRRADLRS